jgi:hypothetical protein
MPRLLVPVAPWRAVATACGVALLCACCAACAPAPDSAALPPTLELIPALPSATPTAVPPSATPSSGLSAPQDVGVSATPSAIETDDLDTVALQSPLLQTDPVARDMFELTRRELAATLDLSLRRVRLAAISAEVWQDTSLGCPLGDQRTSPATINGYRVVLRAGDNEYVYHTDSERAFLCSSGPAATEGTAEVIAAATAEAG